LAAHRHPLEDWASALGKLVSAFQSLELVLRVFLFEHGAKPDQRPSIDEDFYAQPVGTSVLLNPFTDYRTLAELIRAYNAVLPAGASSWTVDEAIAATRDAVAHGRVSASAPDNELRLLKYSKPSHAKATHVEVTFNTLVTLDWLKDRTRAVQSQTRRVVEAHESLNVRPAV
jgi:hypothetical protein